MLIKKTFQGEIPENKIVNARSQSLTDTYSCDYINNNSGDALPINSVVYYSGSTVPEGYTQVADPSVDTYSTTEQTTNKVWIDGRPVYRRTFTGSTGNGSYTVMTTDYYNSAITIINSYGSLGTTSGRVPLNSYVNSNWATGLFIHNEELQIYHGSSCRNGSYVVTIEFVKESDIIQGGE